VLSLMALIGLWHVYTVTARLTGEKTMIRPGRQPLITAAWSEELDPAARNKRTSVVDESHPQTL
jgi:hypothetical protein